MKATRWWRPQRGREACAIALCVGMAAWAGEAPAPVARPLLLRPVLLQAFDAESVADGQHWQRLAQQASAWAEAGVEVLWLPPASKGVQGDVDLGYNLYDPYDLGEFAQKGSVATRWGSRSDLLAAIAACHQAGLQVWADVVLNHMQGADASESLALVRVDPKNRRSDLGAVQVQQVPTRFDFPGRQQADGRLKYRDFRWRAQQFNGIDRLEQESCSDFCPNIYRWADTPWNDQVGRERGNDDFLRGANVNHADGVAQNEQKRWGTWLVQQLNVDGLRLAHANNMPSRFQAEWLQYVRHHTNKTLPTVADFEADEVKRVLNYLGRMDGGEILVFDHALHQHFYEAGRAWGDYDLRRMFIGTLLEQRPNQAVTYVDNHRSLRGREAESQIEESFKLQAYTILLLRPYGMPTVFLGDWDGVAGRVQPWRDKIQRLLEVRKNLAWGSWRDYWDSPDVVGWTWSGNAQHPDGLAVLLTDQPNLAGRKRMSLGPSHAGHCYRDLFIPAGPAVCLDEQGQADFTLGPDRVGVWVKVKTSPYNPARTEQYLPRK